MMGSLIDYGFKRRVPKLVRIFLKRYSLLRITETAWQKGAKTKIRKVGRKIGVFHEINRNAGIIKIKQESKDYNECAVLNLYNPIRGRCHSYVTVTSPVLWFHYAT